MVGKTTKIIQGGGGGGDLFLLNILQMARIWNALLGEE